MTSFYSRDDAFWDNYVKGRPQVPDSFFERLFAYHAEHGGQFGTIHEAGVGPGVHSPRLAKRFNKVIVTDISENNIEIAKARLTSSQYEFHVTTLEDTITFTPASVDMVCAATMIHFTDIDKALDAVAHQLQPGGTFTAFLTGFARLEDSQAQEVWVKLFHQIVRQVLQKLTEALISALACQSSGYDSIHIPESSFEPGALRIKTNELSAVSRYHAYVPPEYQTKYALVSNVGPNDKVMMEDDEDWSFQKDIHGLKQVVLSFPIDHETDEMNTIWQELETVVGERQIEGKWLVSTILATRKQS